eukprot:CAMPEP_0172679636 /NCGR_PEP_ID=MMETSP1074-20121228/16205_1 /TAXON_ID=2916 /ORGANISM="Ceratium fusus, Strain PA161109" /LENGTH=143 /DNA_ID=CAMNT_0013497835 /DNA_START=258 /DNA_END=690 /DNA_ORIENTATION=+
MRVLKSVAAEKHVDALKRKLAWIKEVKDDFGGQALDLCVRLLEVIQTARLSIRIKVETNQFAAVAGQVTEVEQSPTPLAPDVQDREWPSLSFHGFQHQVRLPRWPPLVKARQKHLLLMVLVDFVSSSPMGGGKVTKSPVVGSL